MIADITSIKMQIASKEQLHLVYAYMNVFMRNNDEIRLNIECAKECLKMTLLALKMPNGKLEVFSANTKDICSLQDLIVQKKMAHFELSTQVKKDKFQSIDYKLNDLNPLKSDTQLLGVA